jgi:hypothetical protein
VPARDPRQDIHALAERIQAGTEDSTPSRLEPNSLCGPKRTGGTEALTSPAANGGLAGGTGIEPRPGPNSRAASRLPFSPRLVRS